jgi:hypothetical protein
LARYGLVAGKSGAGGQKLSQNIRSKQIFPRFAPANQLEAIPFYQYFRWAASRVVV